MPTYCPAGWSERSLPVRVTVPVLVLTDLICWTSIASVPSPTAIHFIDAMPLASVPVSPATDERRSVLLPWVAGAVSVAEVSW